MFQKDILSKVEEHVTNASSRLDVNRYFQESAYVDAFMARLDGVIDLGAGNGRIELKSTIVADRGRGSAENKYGADFCLVFEGVNQDKKIAKAVIAQAKKGSLKRMPKKEIKRLADQCEKMANVTDHYIVLETPEVNGAMPNIKIGSLKDHRWHERSIPFHQYLVDYIISCKHGDRRSRFIEAVAHSKLTKLDVEATGLKYEPNPPGQSFNL